MEKNKKTRDLVSQKQVEVLSLQRKLAESQDKLGLLLAHPTSDKPKDDEQLAQYRRDADALKTEIEESQLAISVLEKDIVAGKSRDSEIAKLLKQQKALVPKMLELSTFLVEQLEIAVNTNTQLKDLQKEYDTLRKRTGKNLLPDKFAGGSSDYLEVVYSVLSRELRDGARPGRLVQTSLRV